MRTTAAGMAGALGLTLLVGSWLAAPGRADTPTPTASTSAPATTATMHPTTTWMTPSSPIGSPSDTCYHYTPPTPGPGGVMQSLDFEDGTTAGVYGSGNVTVRNTTEAAAGGTHSLRADGLTTTDDVVLPSARLSSYAWHRVTAKVRLAAGQPAAVVTLRSTSTSGSLPGSVRVTADGWTEVTAYVKPITMFMDWYCNGTMTGAQAPSMPGTQLALDVAACGGPDRPTSVLVDDVVVAIDAVTGSPNPTATGGPTPSSPPPPGCGTSTPPSPPAPLCLGSYSVTTSWPGGQLAEVRVRNQRPVTLTGWTVRWTFPDDRRVTSLWGGSYTQVGRVVTVTGYGWSPLAPGATATIGLVVTGSGALGTPADVSLDGAVCPPLPR